MKKKRQAGDLYSTNSTRLGPACTPVSTHPVHLVTVITRDLLTTEFQRRNQARSLSGPTHSGDHSVASEAHHSAPGSSRHAASAGVVVDHAAYGFRWLAVLLLEG